MFTITQNSLTYFTIEMECGEGFEQWVMLTGDRHFDAVRCRRDLLKEHMELAQERDAIIIDVGDFFDAMQGKYDPRKDYREMREEYLGTNYLDKIVKDAADWHEPYKHLFALVGMGNHETELERRMNTNLVERMVERWKPCECIAAGYTGYVRFMFRFNKTKSTSLFLKYHHGRGGRAPVTRGVIDTNRMAVMFPDANFVISGHNHESWIVPIAQERINNKNGKVFTRNQWHVRVPSYKDGWGSLDDRGFDIEKGTPKPSGCIWLRFYGRFARKSSIKYEFIPMVE